MARIVHLFAPKVGFAHRPSGNWIIRIQVVIRTADASGEFVEEIRHVPRRLRGAQGREVDGEPAEKGHYATHEIESRFVR